MLIKAQLAYKTTRKRRVWGRLEICKLWRNSGRWGTLLRATFPPVLHSRSLPSLRLQTPSSGWKRLQQLLSKSQRSASGDILQQKSSWMLYNYGRVRSDWKAYFENILSEDPFPAEGNLDPRVEPAGSLIPVFTATSSAPAVSWRHHWGLPFHVNTLHTALVPPSTSLVNLSALGGLCPWLATIKGSPKENIIQGTRVYLWYLLQIANRTNSLLNIAWFRLFN